MVRHIFIATIKEGVSDEIVNQKMEEMRAMKDSVPEIESIMVGRSLGWVGAANTVTMVIDLKDRNAFDTLMASPAHIEVGNKAAEAFETDNFVISQIEY